MLDFNSAEKQKGAFDLIPVKTIVPVIMSIRPGGAGDEGWLKQSQSSDAQMLDCEFTVISGEYAKRKFWQFFVVSGGKVNDKGESIGGNISRQTLRAILEAIRDINPDDDSQAACAKRQSNGWGDFNGVAFQVKVGIEKDKTGQYSDKNKIVEVITPEMKEYQKQDQSSVPSSPFNAAPTPQTTTSTPAWAR